jgi:hypothetical protein
MDRRPIDRRQTKSIHANEQTAQQYGSPPQRLLFVPRFTPSPPPYNVRPRAPGYFPWVLQFGLVGPRAMGIEIGFKSVFGFILP